MTIRSFLTSVLRGEEAAELTPAARERLETFSTEALAEGALTLVRAPRCGGRGAAASREDAEGTMAAVAARRALGAPFEVRGARWHAGAVLRSRVRAAAAAAAACWRYPVGA